MKTTSCDYCAVCLRDFSEGEVVSYTWFENRCFCDDCKLLMNSKVSPKYLDWQEREVRK